MTASRPPVDEAARREIRESLGATLFVEAGAGTGKTTALVSRVVSLVAGGHLSLRDLAAITFTEAAAAELRDRIRFELERAARGESDPPLGAESRARCRAALDELDDAALSTLHGFAQRLLVEHPLEAGLPPRFEVVDDVVASVAFEQHWGEFVERLGEDRELEPVLLDALVLGIDFDRLREVARTLHDHHDRLRATAPPPPALPPVDVAPVLRALDEAIRALSHCTQPDADALARHLVQLIPARDALAGADDDVDRLDLLSTFPKLASRAGRKEHWTLAVAEVRGRLTDAESARMSLLDGLRQVALSTLLGRVRDFVVDYADERRREGRLEFHDLLVLARDVLQRRPEVRAAVARRFRVLLIDEFQDTDPLQIEIAVLLATTDPGAGSKPWWEVPLEAGRVFFVGDPKQSIYRFRRADLALYHRVQADLTGQVRHLVQSFRSVPGIADWVDAVFARLFAGAERGVQAPHVRLQAYRDALPGVADPVRVFGSAATDNVPVVREREAADVAGVVRRIKAEAWPVLDPVTADVRGARYDDIALLLPTRAALPDLEEALERADVPVRVESQSLVFSTAEVRDLLAILTALDDPTDELALVAALRAPAFGCADDELVSFRLAGGRWDYRASPPEGLPADHPVGVALSSLRELHSTRWWQSVSETVEAVIRRRKMLELAVTHRRPRDHWRRLRFLLDQARAYDEAGGGGLRGFVEWIGRLADERARAVEVVVPEHDDDALRVLTVHGAKGLEFPIVVLAGLNALPPRRPPVALWHPDGRFEVGFGSGDRHVATAGWDPLRQEEQARDAAERLRLLYVATTRARDHLVVSLHHKAGTDCHAARLWECARDAPAATIDPTGAVSGPDDRRPESMVDGAVAVDDARSRERWIADRERLLARAGRPATVAATALARGGETNALDPGLDKDGPDDDAPVWRRGRAGTSVGRAVHAVLQSIELGSGAGLDATARAQASAEGIPGRELEVRALARSVLDAPIVREAVRAERYWREVPVACVIGGVTVEGFVDLLVETADGLVVVDYKTDQVPTDTELDTAMARYRIQGAAYALALERTAGRPVARCVFVFARRTGAIERELDDLPQALAEVEQRVRG